MVMRPILHLSHKALPRGVKKINALAIAHEELFKVRHPHLARQPFKTMPEWKRFLRDMAEDKDQWVYWPDEHRAVHLPSEEVYFELRTARNKNLITRAEQESYRNLTVGIAGLSVGASILSSLVLTGGPKRIKIADFDTLETTNLNRVRAGAPDLGMKKIDIAARDVWRVDPFAELGRYDKGLTEENLADFVLGKPRLDLVIDEMDNLAMKIAIRILARRERIPVLMATDYADSALIDVERFDLEPKRKIFHGLVGNLTPAAVKNAPIGRWLAIVDKIIGGPQMPPRHKASLAEIGKTLAGVPQLGTDALSAGAALSLAVRKIATGAPLPSGRYMLDMAGVFHKRILR